MPNTLIFPSQQITTTELNGFLIPVIFFVLLLIYRGYIDYFEPYKEIFPPATVGDIRFLSEQNLILIFTKSGWVPLHFVDENQIDEIKFPITILKHKLHEQLHF